MSIRLRLTIFNAIILLITTLAAFAVGVTLFGVFLFRDPYPLVSNPAHEIAYIMSESGSITPAELDDIASNRYEITIFDANGAIVLQTGTPPGVTPFAKHSILDAVRKSDQPRRETFIGSNDDTFLTVMPVRQGTEITGYIDVRTSYEAIVTSILDEYIFLPIAAVSLIPVALILILISYILTWRALRPVNRIAATANTISETDLSQRLPVRGGKRDEFARLSIAINNLLDRIQRSMMDREQVLAAQRRFVADAGHELRTPLTSIRGYANMLGEWGLQDETVAREGIDVIARESGRLQELAEGLLTIARGDEHLEPDLVRGDLRGPVAESVEALRMNSRGVVLDAMVPTFPVLAMFDDQKVRQLVTILLDNAVKYSPSGSTVTATAVVSGGVPTVVVRDSGMGISEEDLPKIFQRFYRVDQSRGKRGAGLGLSIAHQIVDMHEGRITVQSYPGQGTTFMVTFKAPPVEAMPAAPSQTRRFVRSLLERLHLRKPAKS